MESERDRLTKLLEQTISDLCSKTTISPLFSAGDADSVARYYDEQRARTITVGELSEPVRKAREAVGRLIVLQKIEDAWKFLKEQGEVDEETL